MRDELLAKGCIRAEMFESDNPLTLYALTSRGKSMLADMGVDTTDFPQHLSHAYGVNLLKRGYESQGCTVQLEYPIKSGFVDLAVTWPDGKLILVEFETGKSDAMKNLRSCLAHTTASEVMLRGFAQGRAQGIA